MKYFIDTEFLEGTQKKTILGIPYGETKPMIDLISIGIVAEDGREYYAISKDFNLKEAWNRYDLKPNELYKSHGLPPVYDKIYWIRDNVLKPLFIDLANYYNLRSTSNIIIPRKDFNLKNLKFLINYKGKTREELKMEITMFCNPVNEQVYTPVEFYTYYGAYDHVVLCWIYGKMIELPKGFPMYTRDLKQIFDEKNKSKPIDLKEYAEYPKQEIEHNALLDARWNKKLYEFLIKQK